LAPHSSLFPPTPHQQAVARQLAAKSGNAFDETWTKDMIAGHRKAIEMTTEEIRNGSSKELQTLAKNALPVLQKHLGMLENAANTPHGSP
jgi:putative membrane protein